MGGGLKKNFLGGGFFFLGGGGGFYKGFKKIFLKKGEGGGFPPGGGGFFLLRPLGRKGGFPVPKKFFWAFKKNPGGQRNWVQGMGFFLPALFLKRFPPLDCYRRASFSKAKFFFPGFALLDADV